MNVIVVDDHPLFVRALELLMEEQEDINIIGMAFNGEQALELIKREKPDIVLVDLKLAEENGLNVIKQARKVNSSCKYIILTAFIIEEEVTRAVMEDVDGYLLKEAYPEELISAIRVVAKNRKCYDSKIMKFVLEKIRNQDNNIMNGLTNREREVLMALSRGMNNKAIAEELMISENTVKKHVRGVLGKLKLKDRTQAALFAANLGVKMKA